MLDYHKIGTVFSEQLRNSPIDRITGWYYDSIISGFLFWHYLPSNIITGTQPQWNLLFEPTRSSLGPWLGSNICNPN